MYIPGDHWKVCDRCGFDYRKSETRKEWTGLIVCSKCFEPKHPALSPSVIADKQGVHDARPRQTENFLSPGDVTADSL